MFCANYFCWLPSCQKRRVFFASLIAFFTWFLAHLNWSHIARLLEEIAFFLRKSRFRILLSNSLIFQEDRFFRILLDLNGACLSTQPRNISFHTRHISLVAEYKSTLAQGSWLRSLKNFPLLKCLTCRVAITRGPIRQYWVLLDKKNKRMITYARWMTPEFVTFSGEFVMHKSINVFESGVTRVGSVINWLRLYISKMFIRWEELTVIASGNKLQSISPSKYNSLFSASILAITFSNSLNKLGGELGGRYQVQTRNGVLRGLLISTKRDSKRSLFKSLRIR